MSEATVCLAAEKNITLQDSEFVNEVVFCCVNGLLVLLNMVANGIVVYKYYQTRSKQPVSNTPIFLLASFDLLKGATAHPVFISARIVQEIFGIFNCTLQSIADAIICIFLGFAFIMATIVVTSERFFAILYPIRHRVYMRKKMLVYVSFAIFTSWVICVTMLHNIRPSRFTELHTYMFVLTFGLIYTLAVYVKIFYVSRGSMFQRIKHSRTMSCELKKESSNKGDDKLESGVNWKPKMHELQTVNEDENCLQKSSRLGSGTCINSYASNNQHHNNTGTVPSETSKHPCHNAQSKSRGANESFNLTAKEKKTIFRMLCIVGVLYLTSIPILATFAYEVVKGTDSFLVNYLYPWAKTVQFSNGIINAYIYCYRNEHFRIRKPAVKNIMTSTILNLS